MGGVQKEHERTRSFCQMAKDLSRKNVRTWRKIPIALIKPVLSAIA